MRKTGVERTRPNGPKQNLKDVVRNAAPNKKRKCDSKDLSTFEFDDVLLSLLPAPQALQKVWRRSIPSCPII